MGIFVGMMGCIYGREDTNELPANIESPFLGSGVV